MHYRFIKFNDKNKVTVNIMEITLFWSEKIEGSNPYFTIHLSFNNRNSLSLKYDLNDEEDYNKDVDFLQSLVS